MKLILLLLRQSRVIFGLAVVIGLLSGLGNAGFLAIINSAIADGQLAPALAWTFVGLAIVIPASRVLALYFAMRLGQTAVQGLRIDLSEKILDTPLRRVEEVGKARLLVALTDDIGAVSNAVVFVPTFAINLAIVVSALGYLGWLSWQMLIGLVIMLAIGILGYQLPMMAAMKRLQQARDERDHLYASFRRVTDGMKELKLHRGRRRAMIERLRETANTLRDLNISSQTIFNAAASWGQVLVFVVIGIFLYLLPKVEVLSVEALIGYVIVLLYIMTPLQMLLNSIPQLGRASVAVRAVERLGLTLFEETPESSSAAPITDLPQAPKTLQLKSVTHAYFREGQEGQFTLGPIDLTLKSGEITFLTGGNGSGKTTLAKVLIGLYEPESGEILLDDKPVTDANRESFRQSFSAIFADFFLFEELLGIDVSQRDEKAREYLRLLRLDHKVEIADGRLSTTDLSQGQRKRLALMVAFLEDRPIYVFDEWAADQDPDFKKFFYHHLLPELKARNKMILAISHDDHFYSTADRLIKMDYGRIESDQRSDLKTPISA